MLSALCETELRWTASAKGQLKFSSSSAICWQFITNPLHRQSTGTHTCERFIRQLLEPWALSAVPSAFSFWPSPWPDSSGGSVAGSDFESRNLCHRLVDGMQMATGWRKGRVMIVLYGMWWDGMGKDSAEEQEGWRGDRKRMEEMPECCKENAWAGVIENVRKTTQEFVFAIRHLHIRHLAFGMCKWHVHLLIQTLVRTYIHTCMHAYIIYVHTYICDVLKGALPHIAHTTRCTYQIIMTYYY